MLVINKHAGIAPWSKRKPPIEEGNEYSALQHPFVQHLHCDIVPGAGLEPARPYGQRILSPLRLPFRHPGWNTSELIYSVKRS